MIFYLAAAILFFAVLAALLGQFLLCPSPRPRLIRGLGTLPAAEPECGSKLVELLRGQRHFVRVYGILSDRARAGRQARTYVPSERMQFPTFLAAMRDGTAHDRGMYWAMFSGDEDAQNGRRKAEFQRRLRALVRRDKAERELGLPWSRRGGGGVLALWCGPAGHTEQLHYDAYSNVHFQLRGTKTWRLFPPHHNLAPVSVCDSSLHGGCNFSRCSLASPDFKLFPALRRALAEEVTITVRPGEAVYVPAGWWHEVSGSGDDYCVSTNWFEPDDARPPLRRFQWRFLRLGVAEWTDWVRNTGKAVARHITVTGTVPSLRGIREPWTLESFDPSLLPSVRPLPPRSSLHVQRNGSGGDGVQLLLAEEETAAAGDTRIPLKVVVADGGSKEKSR